MIDYHEKWLCSVIWRCNGSVTLWASAYGLLAALLCVALQATHEEVEDFLENFGIGSVIASQTWSASTAMLALLLALRTQMAFKRFWEGTSLLHQMRGEWFDAVNCLVSFTRGASETKPTAVWLFRHTVVRLMSLMHASALGEIANESHLRAIDILGLDHETLMHLKHTERDYGFNKVETLLHIIQSTVTQALLDGVIQVPPPILSRVYQVLSRGFVKLLNAHKIRDTLFPFPYAQLIAQLLFLNLVLTPVMMASLIKGSTVLAAFFTFLPVFGMFSLNSAASQLENPFGRDANDLGLEHFQKEMNRCLLMLLHDRTDHLASLQEGCIRDFDELVRRGVHVRHQSIVDMKWSLHNLPWKRRSSRSSAAVTSTASQRPTCWSEMATAMGRPAGQVRITKDFGALEAPIVAPETLIALEQLLPKVASLCRMVDEFGYLVPRWTEMIEEQVIQLVHTFRQIQHLANYVNSR